MNIPSLTPNVGSMERVYGSHVNDLNDFYLYSSWSHHKLPQLDQQLAEAYSQSSSSSTTASEEFNIGDYCVYQSENEVWYRGLIRERDSNGNAIVFKIDYGDVQRIPIRLLRPLQKWAFEVPRLAIHCSLADLVKPINGWSSEVINQFGSQLTKSFLYGKFISYNQPTDILSVEIKGKESNISVNKVFEPYQKEQLTFQMSDKLVYKHIPMEKLCAGVSYKIHLLYYINPSHFYVYLREKTRSHNQLQNKLQEVGKNLSRISSSVKYQAVAVEDNNAMWLRGIILDFSYDLQKFRIYFIDIGQIEFIPKNKLRQLPDEFLNEPALAVPCRLYSIGPINGNEQPIWKPDDKVHDEFQRLMVNYITCQVVRLHQDQVYYDVEIIVPDIDDLGTFLVSNNLASRPTSISQHSTITSSEPSQLAASGTTLSGRQTQTTTGSTSTVPIVPPNDGYYWISQIYSATEFYAFPYSHRDTFDGVCKDLKAYYDSFVNDQSLNVTVILDGNLCAIQQSDKYYRVIIRRRESQSKVLVKLIDRGDEIIVHTSELLQIDNKFSTIPAFVQPFRLHHCDESQNSANVIRQLKKLLFNQSVYITRQGSMINGSYPVEVILSNQQSLNKMILQQ
ncbi:unnamed protein product [Rotaria magnacalcarata]|uniref:Tudor domain-containing protein n=1 Tax=Rotaria magnacalcarata TaxID=392030 RepID=A0A816TSR7_9BILA|nr:unnamed protein product [Rotaria magnacalcarata]CAF3889669.1 unnamed protein product [Rotaria magnacalcarata]